jgi:hypothetical protein
LANVPKSDGLDLALGVARRNDKLRGVLNASARINDAVSFVAKAEAASASDWSALAGLKVRW